MQQIALKQTETGFLAMLEDACIDLEDKASSLILPDLNSIDQVISLWKTIRDWKDKLKAAKDWAIEPARKQIADVTREASRLEAILSDAEATLEDKLMSLFLASDSRFETFSTVDGSIYEKKNIKYKISDPSLLPASYMMPDEKKIEKLVKAGVVIPGVDVYEEKSLIMKRK